MSKSQRSSFWAWSAYDAGNSAHALLVSTVGFALYFQQFLFAGHPRANSLWALLTVLVLSVSGIVSPFLTSWLAFHGRRAEGLVVTTIGCVVATICLGLPLVRWLAVGAYFVSAIGYYVALPVYNTYIEDVAESDADRASARAWAVGYIGGIAAVALAFALHLLSKPVSERPDLYRLTFVVAGVFNLVCSIPLLLWAWRRREVSSPPATRWKPIQMLRVLKLKPKLLRLFLSYWMVGECGTITVYFTAIFLAQYAGMPVSRIFTLTLAVQAIGAASTWVVGDLAVKLGSSRVFRTVCVIWSVVPILLWLISKQWPYWPALIGIGLVIGAHHAIIRAEVAKIVAGAGLTVDDKGSVFGFLEVVGRITSIVGPLAVAILTFFVPLSQALLVACLFPLLALLINRKYEWQPSAS